MPRYSIVVPVYNEGPNIARFCARVVDELPADCELLIVYDFEEDDTLPALAALAPDRKPPSLAIIRNTLGRGVRNAIVAGMKAATAPVVVVMMADLSDDFGRVEEMIARVEAGADVVCASRYMKGGRQLGGGFKSVVSRAAGMSLHAAGALPVHDPTNSFKAYRRAFLEATPVESEKGFALAMELTVKAHLRGGRVEEVPATWTDRVAGTSRFRLLEWLPVYLRWYFLALRQRRVFWNVMLPLALLLAIGTIVPVRHDSNVRGEYWLTIALHDAFLRGRHFGSEVVFTFGPWGFLLSGVHPGTIALSILLRLITVVAVVVVLQRRVAKRAGTAASVVAIAVLAVVTHICWADTLFCFIPLLLLLEGFERADDKRTSPLFYLLLIGAAALFGLAKFSFMTSAVIAVIAVSIDELRRRKAPWTAVTFVFATALLWIAAGQRVADFLPFLRDSAELASAYGDAMGLASPLYAPPTFIPFLISAGGFAVLVAMIELRRQVGRGLLFTTALCALLFVLFKSGFVRADFFHIAPACGALLVIQLCYAAVRLRAALTIPILLSLYTVGVFTTGGFASESIATVSDATKMIARMACWPTFERDTVRLHATLVSSEPMPPAPMRGDFVPVPAGLAFTSRFTYQPRPVFISYCVYTPSLSKRNADWFRANLPPAVLFDLAPIDRHFPSLEDGALWPILLSRYDATGRFGTHIVLTKRTAAASEPPRLAASIRARLGERVTLPAQTAAARFARVRINLTTAGKVARILYKTPPLTIRVGLEDGSEKHYRFIRGMGESEFLLSPLIMNRQAFADLVNGQAVNTRVLWMLIEPERAGAYESDLGIELLDWR